MMISRNKTMVWSNVPKELKRRLEALRKIDPMQCSESKVIWRALEHYLPIEEAQVLHFHIPIQKTPRKRVRAA